VFGSLERPRDLRDVLIACLRESCRRSSPGVVVIGVTEEEVGVSNSFAQARNCGRRSGVKAAITSLRPPYSPAM